MIPCIAPPIFNGQPLGNFFLKIARNSPEITGCQLSKLQQNFHKHFTPNWYFSDKFYIPLICMFLFCFVVLVSFPLCGIDTFSLNFWTLKKLQGVAPLVINPLPPCLLSPFEKFNQLLTFHFVF